MKFTSQPTLVVPWPGAEVFQPYWETYLQACTETLAYSNKMTQLAMEAWQGSLSGPFHAAAVHPQAGGFKAAPDVAATMPDLLANMQQWQAAMLNNVSQWQEQMKDQFQGASASTLNNLYR